MSRLFVLALSLTVAGFSPAAAQAGPDARPVPAHELIGSAGWDEYFPFRLGDSWTYDWKTEGPMAPAGTASRTRVFDGTTFLSDQVGYKLVSDDGSTHLYSFHDGVLSLHSSLEAGRYYDYDPPVVIAAPDLRVGQSRVVEHPAERRRFTTSLLGLESVAVPFGTFPRALAIRVEMEGPEYTSEATHYFAPGVGLVAYRYTLRETSGRRVLLGVDATLRLARLAGHHVASTAELARTAPARSTPGGEDRGLRDLLRAALGKRYTWDAAFPGFSGEATLVETGKAPVRGRFVVGPDLSVKVDAGDEVARAALRNEISSFVTQRKDTVFDLAYAETTFARKTVRPDGAVVAIAVGDPLATSYTVKDGDIVEVGRSMGRVSYLVRERSRLRTEDGRSITVEYDVSYLGNETQQALSVERTRDAYGRLGTYWVPLGRAVEKQEGGATPVSRQLVLTDVRIP